MRSKLQNVGSNEGYDTNEPAEPYLSEDVWEIVQSLVASQEYPSTTKLFQQDSPAQDIYLIDKGLIKLIYLSEAGQELIVGLVVRGGIMGAASAILHKRYPVTAVTSTKCFLRRIPAGVFVRLLKTDAAFSWQVHHAQSNEVYDHIANVTALGCHSARHRLEQLLRQLVIALELDPSLKDIHLKLPLRHWEIAELIAITPAYLSRLFSQLEQDGILQRASRELIISGFDRLTHRSAFCQE